MARKDITGQRFGRLTAVRPLRSEKNAGVVWLCRCDCGGEKEVPASLLLRGTTQSCGCLARERTLRNDITGQRFGRLVAKEFRGYNEKKQDCWLFQCDCGKEKVLPAANVKWGGTRSCGCLHQEHSQALNRQDITGERFGRLVAVRPTQERDAAGSIVWECRCDCGQTALYSVNALRKGTTRSCGCLYQQVRPECVSYRKDMVDSTALSSLVQSKQLRSNNTSGCTGVYREKKYGHWVAYINFQKHRYSLGVYPDKEQAIQARKDAEQRLHDPAIEANWEALTQRSQERFLEYVRLQSEK